MKSKKNVRVKKGGVFPSFSFKKVDAPTCTDVYKAKLYDNKNITDPRDLHEVYQKCCLQNQSSIKCQMLKGRFKSVLRERNNANEYYGYDQSLDENPSMSAAENYNKNIKMQPTTQPTMQNMAAVSPINESGGFGKKMKRIHKSKKTRKSRRSTKTRRTKRRKF